MGITAELAESRLKPVTRPIQPRTDSNPFSLEALAVFIFRVLQRVNHPGNLDKASPNAGYVLLMFYHIYDGKNRREFEHELVDRFGTLVKMPLLKADRTTWSSQILLHLIPLSLACLFPYSY